MEDNIEVIDFLKEASGYNTDKDLLDWILYSAKTVYSEIGSSHRWYDEKNVVINVNDRFISYNWYHMTGDSSVSDMDLEFDWNAVRFVEPYEVTVTKYR